MWADGAYERVLKDDGTEDKHHVKCCQCDKVMKKHSGTSNMITHMERKHYEFWTKVIAGKNNQPKINKYTITPK